MKKKETKVLDAKDQSLMHPLHDENNNDIMCLFEKKDFHDAIIMACCVLEVFTSADDRAFGYMLKKLYNFFVTPFPEKSLLFDYKVKMFMILRLIYSNYEKRRYVISGNGLSIPWLTWFIYNNAGLEKNFKYRQCLKKFFDNEVVYNTGFTWRPSDEQIEELRKSMKGVNVKDMFYGNYQAEFKEFKEWLAKHHQTSFGTIYHDMFDYKAFDNLIENFNLFSKYTEWKTLGALDKISMKPACA